MESPTSEQIRIVATVWERYAGRLNDQATEDVISFARTIVVNDLPPVLPKGLPLERLIERACESALIGTPARSPRGLVRHKVRELARLITSGRMPKTFVERERMAMIRPVPEAPRQQIDPRQLAVQTKALTASLKKPSFA